MANLLATTALILAKIESTYGTDPLPAKAVDAILVEGLSLGHEADMQERDSLRPDLGRRKHSLGRRHMTLSFDYRFRTDDSCASYTGTDDTAQRFDPLLRACGFSPTYASGKVTYNPVSSSFESAAFYIYKSGHLYKLLGTRGNVEFHFTAGQDFIGSFTFSARYATPTDTSMPTDPTYETTDNFQAKNMTALTRGAYSLLLENLSCSLNNDVVVVPDPTDTYAVEKIYITGRNAGGSMDPEAELEATESFWGDLDDLNEQAVTATFATPETNDEAQLYMPKVQYQNITPAERTGIYTYDIPFGANVNSGDDEIQLKFGDEAEF